ncbi:MAG TPA: class I SAM-dependent methyltransferase [Burkholderiales bacterium]|nr:class I SAM-dependent methyltransferase [Burkholderiales bacterium]
MWDERYSSIEYAYGKTPNDFLAAHFSRIPRGNVLSLAEGEGRNAVFLAKHGYSVTAVDSSIVGLKKAELLAKEHGVSIKLVHADLSGFDLGSGAWKGIISIFVPLPSAVRKDLYRRLQGALESGGVFLLEAFTPDQIGRGTGGGTDPDTMQTERSLRAELPSLKFEHLAELERKVVEGAFHTGQSAVVQAIARKET